MVYTILHEGKACGKKYCWFDYYMAQSVSDRFFRILSSVKFFYGCLVFFVLQAAYIASTIAFSASFDEGTHLGIIKLYSSKWLPFWSGSAPPGSEAFGAVTRDPSYIYHYLFSFPYRVLEQFIHSETTLILILRFVNIALFVAGLIIFRKLLIRAGASKALAHTTLAIFIITPLASFLAAHLNYENLLFVLVAGILLVAQSIQQTLRNENKLDIWEVYWLTVLCLLSSLIKYAFLPVFLTIALYLVVVLIRFARKSKSKNTLKVQFNKFYKQSSSLKLILAATLIAVSFGLFAERYAYNVIAYKTPAPECDQVLDIEQCQSYVPWARNYRLRQAKITNGVPEFTANPVRYGANWANEISRQPFYTLSGAGGEFKTGQPLTITRMLSVGAVLFGVILFLLQQKKLRKIYDVDLLITVMVVYTAILFLQNYMDFVHLGELVAVQARYLTIMLPVLYFLLGTAYNQFLRTTVNTKEFLVFAIFLILVTQGGGASIYILRSDTTWYMPNNAIARSNIRLKKILSTFTIGS